MLKGKLNILGYKMFCRIKVIEPSNLSLEGKLDKLSIAGGLIMLSNKDLSHGPVLNVNVNTTMVRNYW